MEHLTDDLLNEYLDHALDEQSNAIAQAHLSNCRECRLRLANLQSLFAALASLPESSLGRDLSASILGSIEKPNASPRYLRLAVVLQVVLSGLGLIFAAPFLIRVSVPILPAMDFNSFAGMFIRTQRSWFAVWRDLSQLELPALPDLPAFELSNAALFSILAGVLILWLAGNTLLLKRQEGVSHE